MERFGRKAGLGELGTCTERGKCVVVDSAESAEIVEIVEVVESVESVESVEVVESVETVVEVGVVVVRGEPGCLRRERTIEGERAVDDPGRSDGRRRDGKPLGHAGEGRERLDPLGGREFYFAPLNGGGWREICNTCPQRRRDGRNKRGLSLGRRRELSLCSKLRSKGSREDRELGERSHARRIKHRGRVIIVSIGGGGGGGGGLERV